MKPEELEVLSQTHLYHPNEFQRLFENAQVGLMYISGSRVLLRANQRLANILGYDTPEEMKGFSMLQLHLSQKNFELFGKENFESLRLGVNYHIEYQLRKKNGSPLWVELSGKALDDKIPADLKKGVLWVIYDISLRKQYQENLLKSEFLKNNILSTLPDLIWLKDIEGNYLACNPVFERFFGAKSEKIIGKTDYDFVNKELADFFRTHDKAAMAAGKSTVNEEWITFADNNERVLLETTKTPLKKEDGEILGVLGIGHDITARQENEIKLKNSLSLIEAILDSTDNAILVIDNNRKMIKYNASFLALWRIPKQLVEKADDEAMLNFVLEQLLSPNLFIEKVIYLYDNPTEDSFDTLTFKDERIFERYSKPMFIDGKVVARVWSFRDITQKMIAEKKLQHIAYYDPLTHLPNRVLLADRMQQAMISANRHKSIVAVIYIDLDGFKEINDTYGHDVGDAFLIAITKIMKKSLREDDTLSRLGGDEFVVIMHNLSNKSESTILLQRLLKIICTPVYIENNEMKVSASIGVSYYPQSDNVDADQLLRQADQAMYSAKLSGKNRYHFFDEIKDKQVRGKHESIERIQQAFNNKEFELYFQPKVNMKTGKIIGAEALIRWNHPEFGLLHPAKFLPIIQHNPLAIEIDIWVLHSVLKTLIIWQKSGMDYRISINIFPYHIQQKGFTKNLSDILKLYPELRPNTLELEIIESSAFDDIEKMSELLLACKEHHVEFALDDFGTGYSSLHYLKKLPSSWLKIDQSFIRFLLENPEDLSIVQAILTLAKTFKQKVIAEGVEAEAHGDILLKMGCEYGQGYGIAKPMPIKEFLIWQKTWKPYNSWLNTEKVAYEKSSLIFADVKHQAWLYQLEAYLLNNHPYLPPQNHHLCQFGEWLDNEAVKLFGQSDEFQTILQLHEQLHASAKELAFQKNNKDKSRLYFEDGLMALSKIKNRISEVLQQLMYNK